MLKIKSISIRLLVVVLIALTMSATASASPLGAAGQPDFGPNVMIFDPSMPTSQIQA